MIEKKKKKERVASYQFNTQVPRGVDWMRASHSSSARLTTRAFAQLNSFSYIPRYIYIYMKKKKAFFYKRATILFVFHQYSERYEPIHQHRPIVDDPICLSAKWELWDDYQSNPIWFFLSDQQESNEPVVVDLWNCWQSGEMGNKKDVVIFGRRRGRSSQTDYVLGNISGQVNPETGLDPAAKGAITIYFGWLEPLLPLGAIPLSLGSFQRTTHSVLGPKKKLVHHSTCYSFSPGLHSTQDRYIVDMYTYMSITRIQLVRLARVSISWYISTTRSSFCYTSDT